MPILFDWNFAKRDDGEDANNYLIASYGCVFGIALPRFIIIFIWGNFDDQEAQDFVHAFRRTHSDNRDPPDKSTFFRAHDRVTVEYWGCTFEDDEPACTDRYELLKYFARAFGPQENASVLTGFDIEGRCKVSQYAFRIHQCLMIKTCFDHRGYAHWQQTGMSPAPDLDHVVRIEYGAGNGFRGVLTRLSVPIDTIDDRAPPLNLTDDQDPWADAPISSMKCPCADCCNGDPPRGHSNTPADAYVTNLHNEFLARTRGITDPASDVIRHLISQVETDPCIEGQNRIDLRNHIDTIDDRPSRPRPPQHPPPHTMSNLSDAVGGGEVSSRSSNPFSEHGRWPEGQLHGRRIEETTDSLPPWASIASSSQGGGQDSQKRKLEHKCKLICPEGHQPVSVLSQSRGICDVCTCAVEAGQHIMDCEPCNYYVCNTCFGAMDGELVAVIAKGALQHVGYVAEDTSSMYADHTPSAEDWLNSCLR